jgi:hypothetical protein
LGVARALFPPIFALGTVRLPVLILQHIFCKKSTINNQTSIAAIYFLKGIAFEFFEHYLVKKELSDAFNV